MKNLPDWLAYCEQLHPKNIDMGLERVRMVAARMGLALNCPVITVAGTNGKGSTCAMLESILLQAGYRTAVYSSPHLVHFEERLRLQGQPVQADALVAGFAAVEAARTQGEAVSLTYFEFSTLAILDVIRQTPLDVVIAFLVGFGASAIGWNGVYLAEVARRAPPGMASMATGGTLAFTFLGVVVGPPMFGALSGLFGTYRAGFVGLMVMASISGTVLYWTQRPR